MFGSLTSGALGRKFEMLSEGYPMAPWEISQLDRHMLSYCVSLENTPTQVCGVATAALLSCCPLVLSRRRMLLCWSLSRLPRAAAAARSMVRDAAGRLPAAPPVRT
jgi:hypothetical protein